jgi:hypothetical protein
MQLAQMTGLEIDWAVEGIDPPNETAYTNARLALTVIDILNIPIEYTTASASGGIVVCLTRGEVYADLECFNTGELWAVVSNPGATPESWQIGSTKAEVEDALQRISSVTTPQYA